ncbi:MAG: hypothetical protein FWE70_01695 [Oscillospiraceae bacterium]|nr:hypothetical protein [Oscillospiraceae bacterium]
MGYFRKVSELHKDAYDRFAAHKGVSLVESDRDRSKPAKPTGHHLREYALLAGEHPVLREARAIRAFMSNCAVEVDPRELVVGNKPNGSREVSGFHFGGGTFLRANLLDEYMEGMGEARKAAAQERVRKVKENRHMAYWDPDFTKLNGEVFTEAETFGLRTCAAGSTWFNGHVVVDYERVLKGINARRENISDAAYAKGIQTDKMGIHAIRSPSYTDDLSGYTDGLVKRPPRPKDAAKAEMHDLESFYMGMHYILDTFAILIQRTAMACFDAAKNERDPDLRRNMLDLHADLTHISAEPPETFRQALQLVWFAHIMADTDTFGRFDKYLYPFYERDLRKGTITEDDALYLLKAFMVKVDEASDIQNMTVGGLMPNGSPSYSGLTSLILRAVREAGYKGPNLCLRVNGHMDDALWTEAYRLMRTGQGLPALYSDDVMVAQLTGAGIPLRHARDYCLAGCSQIMVPGRCQFVNDIGLMNVAKILELTLYGGVDLAKSKADSGFSTGDIASYDGFEGLMEAFKLQLAHYAAMEASVNNKIVGLVSRKEGYAFRTLFVEDCLAKGRNIYNGGALYNNTQLECIGITNAADSLYAIKKVIYDEGFATPAELRDALLANFEGYGRLRSELMKAPKFGNDDDGVDTVRADITRFLFDELRRQDSFVGGKYVPGEVIFVVHDPQGKNTGATPDGRLDGECLADSAGASQGKDISGPTALLNSVLKIPVDGLCTTIVCNMRFSKSLFSNNGRKPMSLIRSFFREGGQQIQVNVTDKNELLRAMEEPGRHMDLIVRVGGYSAYFQTLSRRLQMDVINRMEY